MLMLLLFAVLDHVRLWRAFLYDFRTRLHIPFAMRAAMAVLVFGSVRKT